MPRAGQLRLDPDRGFQERTYFRLPDRGGYRSPGYGRLIAALSVYLCRSTATIGPKGLDPFYPNGKYGITGRQRLKYRKLARKGRTGI